MKTIIPSYIDEEKTTTLRTTDQRLLAEIAETLDKILKLLEPKKNKK